MTATVTSATDQLAELERRRAELEAAHERTAAEIAQQRAEVAVVVVRGGDPAPARDLLHQLERDAATMAEDIDLLASEIQRIEPEARAEALARATKARDAAFDRLRDATFAAEAMLWKLAREYAPLVRKMGELRTAAANSAAEAARLEGVRPADTFRDALGFDPLPRDSSRLGEWRSPAFHGVSGALAGYAAEAEQHGFTPEAAKRAKPCRAPHSATRQAIPRRSPRTCG